MKSRCDCCEEADRAAAIRDAKTSLSTIIDNASTFNEAMRKLAGKHIKVVNLDRIYSDGKNKGTPLRFESCYSDYAIVNCNWACGSPNEGMIRIQGIHKFGTSVAYHLYDDRLRHNYDG